MKEKIHSLERTKKYLFFLFFVLLFVQITDAYTTSYTASFPSKIIEEFMPLLDPNIADSNMAFAVGIATLGMLIVLINQYLVDKFGRRSMLIITTLGMGMSALLLAFSTNLVTYTLYLFLTYLFFSSDIWIIYIAEESDPKRRGFYTNLILALGITGPIMMPIFRKIFLTGSSPVGSWRGMTIFPIILGISIGIIALIGVRETKIYSEYKLGLKIDDRYDDGGDGVSKGGSDGENDDGQAEPKGGTKGGTKVSAVSFFQNTKDIFKTDKKKEIIALTVMSLILGPNFILLQLGESFISNTVGLGDKEVNNVITIIAVAMILGYLVTGFLADKIGRVPLLYVYSTFLPISTIMLFASQGAGDAAFTLASIAMAIGYVGFYGLWIVIRIILMEIVATERRGTASGFRAFIQAISMTAGLFIGGMITRQGGLGIAFIILSIPVLLNIVLTKKYINETKGVDLSQLG
ncbi:MAG: MFS transporter [Promethearchaeota archaeon]